MKNLIFYSVVWWHRHNHLNISTNLSIGKLSGHTNCVLSLGITTNEKILVSSGMDKNIRIWDVTTKTGLFTFTGHTDTIFGLIVLGNDTILSCSADETVKLWKITDKVLISSHNLQEKILQSCCISSDNKMIAVATRSNVIKVLNYPEITEAFVLKGHTNWIRILSFTFDNKYLLTGSDDFSLRIWSIKNKTQIIVLNTTKNIFSFAFVVNKYLAVTSGNSIKVWKLGNIRKEKIFEDRIESILGLTFADETNQEMIKFNNNSCIELREYQNNGYKLLVTKYILFSCTFSDKEIFAWSLESFGLLFKLQGHSEAIKSLCFSVSRNLLFSGSDDKSIKLWNIDSRCSVGELRGHTSSIFSLMLSNDEKLLISGSTKTIKIWNVNQRIEIIELLEPNGSLLSLCFHPNNQILYLELMKL